MVNISKRIKPHQLLVQSAIVLLVYLLFLGYSSSEYLIVLIYSLMLTLITIGASSFIQEVLIPKYLDTGRKFFFLINTLSLFLLVGLITISFMIVSVGVIPDLSVSSIPQPSKNYAFLLTFMYLNIICLNFLNQWQKHKQTELKAGLLKSEVLEHEIEFKQVQLQYLKGQLQPHFLFNTLNTIYGEAIKKSDEAPQLILKLSELLDYTLYQSEKDVVPLVQEVDHIRQYLELERTRFKDHLSITFEEDLDNDHAQIVPLLLLPLVENAFKHGTQEEGLLRIGIQVTLMDGQLDFTVRNSCAEVNEGIGIGLTNLRRRLEVLYPNRHELVINQGRATFIAKLSIQSLTEVPE